MHPLMHLRALHGRVALSLLLPALALADGCQSNRLAPAPPPGSQVDVFAQLARTQSDILWVIDDSQSMSREQDQLANSFPKFFSHMQDAGVDYRIAVTTSDVFTNPGKLFGTPPVIAGNSADPRFPDTPNPEAAFAQNIHVGTMGSPRDEGFEAASLALQQFQAAAADAGPAGPATQFLRQSAGLFLIFVGDGLEYSPNYDLTGVRYYWRQFLQAKGIGNEGLVQVAAIAGTPQTGCPVPVCLADGGNLFWDGGGDAGATDPGDRYYELVELANGFFGSICECNFDPALDQLGVDALGLRHKFILSRPATPDSIQVVVTYPCDTPDPQNNLFCLPDSGIGVACPSGYGAACTAGCGKMGLSCNETPLDPDAGFLDGWSYSASDNSITFTPSTQPVPGAEITVSYLALGAAP